MTEEKLCFRHHNTDRWTVNIRRPGMKLENVTMDMLGTAKKISINKDDTTIVDGAGDKSEIEARVAQIKGKMRKRHLIMTKKSCKRDLRS